MKFNPGDRVREIATGDEGIVTCKKFSSSTNEMSVCLLSVYFLPILWFF